MWPSRPLGYALLDGAVISFVAASLVLIIRAVVVRLRAGECLLTFPVASRGALVVATLMLLLCTLIVISFGVFPQSETVRTPTDILRDSVNFNVLIVVFIWSTVFLRNGAYRNGVVIFDNLIPWSDVRDHQFDKGRIWILRATLPLLQSHLVSVRNQSKSTYNLLLKLLSEREEVDTDEADPVRTGFRWFALQVGLAASMTLLIGYLFGRPVAATMPVAEQGGQISVSFTDEFVVLHASNGEVTLIDQDFSVLQLFKSRLKDELHLVAAPPIATAEQAIAAVVASTNFAPEGETNLLIRPRVWYCDGVVESKRHKGHWMVRFDLQPPPDVLAWTSAVGFLVDAKTAAVYNFDVSLNPVEIATYTQNRG